MSLLNGKEANIYWDKLGTDTQLTLGQSWDMEVTHDTTEITSMQDDWKTYLTGYQDWTATVTTLLPLAGGDISIDSSSNPNGFADVAAQLELYFRWDTGTPLYISLYGAAICNGISYGFDKDGAPTVTYSFQGQGQVQWDTGVARP